MRDLEAPAEDPQYVFRICVESISDQNLRSRLAEVAGTIAISAEEYLHKASNKQLFSIAPNNCRNDDIAIGRVTKKELKNVYSQHLVSKKKAS